MKALQLDCGNCNARLSLPVADSSLHVRCPVCNTAIQGELFPALFRKITPGGKGEAIMMDDESSCFYHPNNKAVIPCEGCGRFLCSLCDVELNVQHLCPQCIEKGIEKGKMEELQTTIARYDHLALMVAVLPVLFWPLTLVSSPAALFIAIRYWRKPVGVMGESRWRLVVAILFAGVQVAGWSFLGITLLGRILS